MTLVVETFNLAVSGPTRKVLKLTDAVDGDTFSIPANCYVEEVFIKTEEGFLGGYSFANLNISGTMPASASFRSVDNGDIHSRRWWNSPQASEVVFNDGGDAAKEVTIWFILGDMSECGPVLS